MSAQHKYRHRVWRPSELQLHFSLSPLFLESATDESKTRRATFGFWADSTANRGPRKARLHWLRTSPGCTSCAVAASVSPTCRWFRLHSLRSASPINSNKKRPIVVKCFGIWSTTTLWLFRAHLARGDQRHFEATTVSAASIQHNKAGRLWDHGRRCAGPFF